MNIILSHDHTDFDAVASQLGAWKLYPDYVPIAGRFLNRNVRDFLTLYWGALPFIYAEDIPPETALERAMLVDTQRIPALKGFNTERIPEVQVIDHHQLREDLPEKWAVELDQTGSCATIFVETIAEQQLSLSWVEATLLLLGIHEDTGSLVYNSSTPRDGRAAAWLMEQGAHLDTLRQFLEHPLTEQQRELYQKLLERQLFLDVGGFQVMITHAKIAQYVDDVSTLAGKIRELYDPAALIVLVEMRKHVQLVARSTTSAIHVGNVMKCFGGGGHPRAAAAFIDEQPLESILEQLKELLPEYVRPTETVSDWMSRGKIRTFAPNTRIHEATNLMQRWGHEGFPVVDEQGKVVGLLTRRDADRALHHKLGNAPLSQFMHKGNFAVTPQMAISQVQRLMTQANIGQLPVISPQTGQLLGIITRTDLLRRIGVIQTNADAKTLLNQLAASLSPATFALVRYIAQQAAQMGFHAYLVGGIVRDLLLNRPMKDLDIVIEGNAIPLAQQLTKPLGGRIVTHKRFGTAKWILHHPQIVTSLDLTPFSPSSSQALGIAPTHPLDWLPAHIDLITARTEFYERPTALPQVEHASIKQDLHRRDFTINTLALSLAPQKEGLLLDFYGGKADLEQGIIRVLHNLSFVEDPTRILRAIRFEQRFGFTLEPRTAELLCASIDLLQQVSPDRVRHELFLSLQEEAPERILKRLDDLNIMSSLLPAIEWNQHHAARFERLRALRDDEEMKQTIPPEHFLAALIWELKAEELDQIAQKIALCGEWHKRLQNLVEVRCQEEALLAAELANSQLYQQLQHYDTLALELLARLTEQEALRQRLRLYLDDLRHRTISVSGHDLRSLGIPPGPIYKTILNTIHTAMLDGKATDEATQREMLAKEVEKR